MIRINKLKKSYGKLNAINDISLEIPRSRIVGIFGPNSSGKTTLAKILLGLLKPDSGEIYVDESRLSDEHFEMIGGYMADAEFYSWLTGLENLMYFLEMKKSEVLQYKSLFFKLGMANLINDKYGTYSISIKQRFGLIYLFMQDRNYLILDEPMTNLDINGIKNLESIIKEEKHRGKGILIISNRLEELEKMCDDVVVLTNGAVNKVVSKDSENDRYIYKLCFSSVGNRKKAELFINSKYEIASPNALRVILKSEHEIEEIIKELSSTSLIEVVRQKQKIYDQFLSPEAVN